MSGATLPDGWVTTPLRRLVTLVTARQEATPDDPVIGLEHVTSWTGEVHAGKAPPANSLAARFRKNDVLFGRLRPYLAKAFLAETDGLASTEFLVLRPRLLSSNFLIQVVLSTSFIRAADSEAYGAKMPRVDWETIGSYSVSHPSSIGDQNRLAAALGRELSLIDAGYRAGEAMLRLCHERALVVAANTIAELTQDVPLVELRRVLRRVEQGWSPEAEERPAEEGEWAVLKLSAVKRGIFYADEHKTLPSTLKPRPGIQVRDGDLLVTRANTLETVADACVVRNPPNRLMLSDLIYRLSPDPKLADPDYLCFWLLSRHARQQIEADARGTSLSMVKVSQELLRRWLVPMPDLTVQREIVARVREAKAKAQGVVENAKAAVSLMRERRAALIEAAVSGRLSIGTVTATENSLEAA